MPGNGNGYGRDYQPERQPLPKADPKRRWLMWTIRARYRPDLACETLANGWRRKIERHIKETE